MATATLDWDERLNRRKIDRTELSYAPGQLYWQLIRGRYIDEAEARGKHHIYVDTLDESGRRATGVPVRFFWGSGEYIRATEAKPGEPHAADFPMFAAGNSYGVQIKDSIPSDSVFGMGLGTIETPRMGNHVSYHFTFQRSRAGTVPPVEPPDPPDPPEPPVPPSDAWARSIAFVLTMEGGYQNHADDIGNWTGCAKGSGILKGTKYGISACSYPDLDIPFLTREQAIAIYERDYWRASGADKLAWPLCLVVFDTAVLHGVGTARTWLTEIGPNPYAFAARRLRSYTRSANWRLFGAGWTNRVIALLEAVGAATSTQNADPVLLYQVGPLTAELAAIRGLPLTNEWNLIAPVLWPEIDDYEMGLCWRKAE